MHIILIEDNADERKRIVSDLKALDINIEVKVFKSVGDFLRSDKFECDVLVLEKNIDLIQQDGLNQKEWEEKRNELAEKFPWTRHKSCYGSGEQLIHHIRQTQKKLPIILYTYENEIYVADDILCDPRFAFCEKKSWCHNLYVTIRDFTIKS
jgi:hypothetical protein